jgi:cell division protein FtsB
MYTNDLLKKQVLSELRKRRYVTYTLLFLSLLYVLVNILFGDTGFMRYRELGRTRDSLAQEIVAIGQENRKLRETVRAYKEDDFYLEKHAREDFGLAEPEEYIFLYEKEKDQ